MTLDRRNPRKAAIPQLPIHRTNNNIYQHQLSAPASVPNSSVSNNTAPSTSSGSSQYSDGGGFIKTHTKMASTY